jgi:hypothetical protein
MLTVTHDDVASLEPAAPSAPYLQWISAGLAEAHGWDAGRVADYLVEAPGVKGAWTWDGIAALAVQGAP